MARPKKNPNPDPGPAERASLADTTPARSMKFDTDDKRFEELRTLSLDRALEIMRLTVDQNHPHFARILATQQAVISSVLTTTVRTDHGVLRGKVRDKYSEMLAAARRLAAERAAQGSAA